MLVCPKSPSYDQNPGKKQNVKNPSSAHCLETNVQQQENGYVHYGLITHRGNARLAWGHPVHTKAWLTPLLSDE